MNSNYKAILLTILTISIFTIAIIELSGISQTAIFNPYKGAATVDKNTGEHIKSRSEQVGEMPKTTMEFYETKFNFGKQPKNSILKHNFRFKNTGTQPLMIAKTDASCGCTVPIYPKEPIAPGAEGEISVVFNSAGRTGTQAKNILVHSNAVPESVSIGIEADIN